MARILVVDDERAQAQLVRLHLESAGHAVAETHSAVDALARLASDPPELIVADVSMPGVDGYALLAAVRANAATRTLPVVFLTALDPMDVLAQAVPLGANQVLQKPLRRDVLLDVVARLLAPARGSSAPLGVTTALRLDTLFRRSRAAADSCAALEAGVLFCDIRGFSRLAERLTPAEAADLAGTFLADVGEHVRANGGALLKTMGDGALALFPSGAGEPHAALALKAAFRIVLAATRFGGWIEKRLADRGLAEFSVGVGVHVGDVQLVQSSTVAGGERTAVGDAVNVAARLEEQTKALGWSIVASDACAAAAGPRFVVGRRATIALRGRAAPVGACEMIGVAPREGSNVQEWRVYREFAAAVTGNDAALHRLHQTAPTSS